MTRSRTTALALALALAGCVLLLLGWGRLADGGRVVETQDLKSLPGDQLVPSRPAGPTASPAVAPTPTPAVTSTPAARPTTAGPTAGASSAHDVAWRIGALDRLGDLDRYDAAALGAGWYVIGAGGLEVPAGADRVYVVWVKDGALSVREERLRQVAAAMPGGIYQIGNEPDVIWQANCTPLEYATVYHQAYTLIKAIDPAARVAAGAVSQPTPLRLEYLDRVLAAYELLYGEPMPVDVWAVHNTALREERGSWGVEIPPGLAEEAGQLYEIEDNDRLDLFSQHLVGFRGWMRDRGYRDRPLYLTEFTVLMPADFGFPPERVEAFMRATFDWLLEAADPELGLPADGNRLVQRWAWYAVAAADYPNGNLFDPVTAEMTLLGRVFASYTGGAR